MDAAVLDISHGLVVGQGGLATVDLSTGALAAHLPLERGYRVAATEGRAYVATRTGAILLVDVADPAMPALVAESRFDLGYHEDIAASGDRVLVAFQENGAVLLGAGLAQLGRLPATWAAGVGLAGGGLARRRGRRLRERLRVRR